MHLADTFAILTGARGQIQKLAWRLTSLTKDVRGIIATLPQAEEQESLIEMNWGEEEFSPYERVFGWKFFRHTGHDFWSARKSGEFHS